MGRRAEGYVRKEITLSKAADLNEYTEIWKCALCGRWHGFHESGTTSDRGVCDACWGQKGDEKIEEVLSKRFKETGQ